MHRPSCIRRALLDNVHMPYPDFEPPLCTVLATAVRLSSNGGYYCAPYISQENLNVHTQHMINWIEEMEATLPLNGELSRSEIEQEHEAQIQFKLAMAWREIKTKVVLTVEDGTTSTTTTPSAVVTTPTIGCMISSVIIKKEDENEIKLKNVRGSETERPGTSHEHHRNLESMQRDKNKRYSKSRHKNKKSKSNKKK